MTGTLVNIFNILDMAVSVGSFISFYMCHTLVELRGSILFHSFKRLPEFSFLVI